MTIFGNVTAPKISGEPRSTQQKSTTQGGDATSKPPRKYTLCKQQGAGNRQLARITGVSYSVIQRLKEDPGTDSPT